MSTIDDVLSEMKPVFRAREFISALGGKAAYAYVALHRLKRAKRIEGIRNGWWAKAGATPEEIASAVSYPCYLSFHSALHAHGLTTQIPRFVQLAVCRKARKYGFEGGEAREYRIKKEEFGGFEVKEGIPIASPEKAFADCLRIPRACPNAILSEAIGGVDIWEVKKACNKRMLKRLKEVETNANARIA
jgi:predicted transcriptional regulator of viral defense system